MLYGLPNLGWPSGLPSFETKDQFLRNYVLGLSSVLSSLRHHGLLPQAPPLEFPPHPHQARDYIFVKIWSGEKLEQPWAGLQQVLLTTETIVCTAKRRWTHYTWVKQTPQGEHWAMSSKPGDLKKTLVGLLFFLQLRNCRTAIRVTQASSPITVKFDACLAIPYGNLKNQGLKIYMCMWLSTPSSYWDNCTSQYNNPSCASWGAVEWTTDQKGSEAQVTSWYSGYTSHPFWKHILQMQIRRAMPPPNC
jgi:hypothetical protein